VAHKNAEDYCKFAKETGKAMKKIDPSIYLVANGSSYYQSNMDWVEWNWKVINELREVADYLSLHRYWESSQDYYEYLGKEALVLEEKISIPAAQAKAVQMIYKKDKPMYLSFDEWAPRGPRGGCLLSTLAAALFFNAFIRHADMVKMANYTLLTSILGRDPESQKTFKTPFFYTFKMFSNECLGKSVDVYAKCNTFDIAGFEPHAAPLYTPDLGDTLTSMIWDPDQRFGAVRLMCIEQPFIYISQRKKNFLLQVWRLFLQT